MGLECLFVLNGTKGGWGKYRAQTFPEVSANNPRMGEGRMLEKMTSAMTNERKKMGMIPLRRKGVTSGRNHQSLAISHRELGHC